MFSGIKGWLTRQANREPYDVTALKQVGDRHGLNVVDGSSLCDCNTTDVPLLVGETFTGEGFEHPASHVGVMVKTDQSGVLYFDFSGDGVNWDSTFPVSGFAVSANIPDFHTAVKLGRYFRVRFVNDSGSSQTYLRLFTYYGNSFLPANQSLNQSVGIDTDAQITRPNDFTDEVRIGRRSGIRGYTKFGYREGLTASAGEETIWAASGNFTPMTTATTFTITFNNSTDGLGTTGANSLYIDYVDENGLFAETQITLDASGSQVTSFRSWY